jgi:hypothetical protein
MQDNVNVNVANEKIWNFRAFYIANFMAITVVVKNVVQVAGPPDPEEMQPTGSFEASAIIYQSTWRNVPEDFKQHLYNF